MERSSVLPLPDEVSSANWRPNYHWRRRNIYINYVISLTTYTTTSLKKILTENNNPPYKCVGCGRSPTTSGDDESPPLFCLKCLVPMGRPANHRDSPTAFFNIMHFLLRKSEHVPHHTLINNMIKTGLWSEESAERYIPRMIRELIIYPNDQSEYGLI